MNQLKDIFNTQFFVILGVVLLLVTCLVLYVEQKFKSYDHKLSSMLSLVSSLAEEFELSKQSNPNLSAPNHSAIAVEKLSNDLEESQLIDVSDNSDSESESESDSESGSDDELDDNESNNLDYEDDSEDDSVNENENENKIISAMDILDSHNDNELFTIKKLETNDIIDLEPEHLEDLDDLNRVEEVDDLEELDDLNEVDDLEELDDLNELDDLDEVDDLEELKDEILDYKKLPVAKLKEIALEKELITSENNKLKKAELLKLLEGN